MKFNELNNKVESLLQRNKKLAEEYLLKAEKESLDFDEILTIAKLWGQKLNNTEALKRCLNYLEKSFTYGKIDLAYTWYDLLNDTEKASNLIDQHYLGLKKRVTWANAGLKYWPSGNSETISFTRFFDELICSCLYIGDLQKAENIFNDFLEKIAFDVMNDEDWSEEWLTFAFVAQKRFNNEVYAREYMQKSMNRFIYDFYNSETELLYNIVDTWIEIFDDKEAAILALKIAEKKVKKSEDWEDCAYAWSLIDETEENRCKENANNLRKIEEENKKYKDPWRKYNE